MVRPRVHASQFCFVYGLCEVLCPSRCFRRRRCCGVSHQCWCSSCCVHRFALAMFNAACLVLFLFPLMCGFLITFGIVFFACEHGSLPGEAGFCCNLFSHPKVCVANVVAASQALSANAAPDKLSHFSCFLEAASHFPEGTLHVSCSAVRVAVFHTTCECCNPNCDVFKCSNRWALFRCIQSSCVRTFCSSWLLSSCWRFQFTATVFCVVLVVAVHDQISWCFFVFQWCLVFS